MDTSPVVLMTGGAGSGKSLCAAEKAHAFCLRYPGAQALVLRKTAQSLNNSVLLMLQRHVIGDDPRVTHHVTNMRFDYDNGSVLAYGGMKDESQREFIRSIGVHGGVDFAWMEEATQFDEEDFNEVISRMRGTAAPWRQIVLTTNPDGPGHWINMRLIIGGEASVYYASAADNDHNPDSYRRSLESLTGVQYQRLVKGLWVAGSGLVFDTWKDSFNSKSGDDNGGNVTLDADYIPDGGMVIWTIDDGYSGTRDKATGMFTGKSHPRAIVMCQRRANGQIAVFGEHLDIHKLAEQHLEEAVTYSDSMGWPRPQRVIRDRAAASLGGAIKKVLNRTAVYNRVPVDESIKEMRGWIAADANGYRRLIVHPRCTHTRFQMSSYSQSENGTIIKEHDHALDCIRYMIFDEVFGERGDVDVASLDSLDDNDYVAQVADDIEHEEYAETGIDIAW